MVRFVAAEIRNPMLSFDRDFFLIRLPEARHRAANQFRDQPCRPGAAALRISDDDNLLHGVAAIGRDARVARGALTFTPEDRERPRRDDRARPAAGAIL